MDIFGDLMKQVGTGEGLTALSSTVGGDEQKVQSALGLALPMVMGSLAQTAARPGGADQLTSMIGQMGGGVAADSPASYLAATSAAPGGTDLVGSILGSQMGTIQNAIAQKTGLPPAVVGTLLAVVTPMILGAVKNRFTDKQMDPGSLSTLLGDEAKTAMQSSPDAAALATQYLEAEPETSGIMGSLKKILGM